MSKKTFGLYIVLIAMAVITIILAIVILVITDDKNKEDRHINDETRAVNQSEVEETYDYVLHFLNIFFLQ